MIRAVSIWASFVSICISPRCNPTGRRVAPRLTTEVLSCACMCVAARRYSRGMMPWSASCSRVLLCWSLSCRTEVGGRKRIKSEEEMTGKKMKGEKVRKCGNTQVRDRQKKKQEEAENLGHSSCSVISWNNSTSLFYSSRWDLDLTHLHTCTSCTYICMQQTDEKKKKTTRLAPKCFCEQDVGEW